MFYYVYIKCFITLVLLQPELNNRLQVQIKLLLLQWNKKFALPRKSMPVDKDYF
jgi:hypothetical protein